MTPHRDADRHKEPITPIRFPGPLKAEMQTQARRHRISMNDIVVKGAELVVAKLKKTEPII